MKSETESRDKQTEKYRNWVLIIFGIALITTQISYMIYFPEMMTKSYEVLRTSVVFIIGFVLVVSGFCCLYRVDEENENEE